MSTKPSEVQLLPRKGRIVAALLCVMNWLLPGTGYLAVGDTRRGLAQFAVINAVLLAGFAFGGYFLPPVFSRNDPNFSLVSLLTFLVQFFHGGGWALASLAEAAARREAPLPLEALILWFGGRPGAVYSDLGQFHLVVAGGLNYYSTVRLYDLLAGNPDPNHEENPALMAAATGAPAPEEAK